MAYFGPRDPCKHVPVIVTSGSEEKQFSVDQTHIDSLPQANHFQLVGKRSCWKAEVEIALITISNSGQPWEFVIVGRVVCFPMHAIGRSMITVLIAFAHACFVWHGAGSF